MIMLLLTLVIAARAFGHGGSCVFNTVSGKASQYNDTICNNNSLAIIITCIKNENWPLPSIFVNLQNNIIMICLHLNPLPKLKMGVVKVPCLKKLSEPQVSADCNHKNPVSGIYYALSHLRTSVESFIDTYQDTSRGREGWGQNG